MSTQEYFHVFEAILYGAIVTQIIVGWSKLIAERGKYNFYWGHLLATVLIFFTIAQRYFASRNMSYFDSIDNTYSFLFYIVLTPAIFFIATYQIFPKKYKGVDFRKLMIEQRASILIPFAIFILAGIVLNFIFTGQLEWYHYVPQLIFIIFFTVIYVTKSLRLFEVALVVIFLMLQYFLIYR